MKHTFHLYGMPFQTDLYSKSCMHAYQTMTEVQLNLVEATIS